jgi:hypothetical protein
MSMKRILWILSVVGAVGVGSLQAAPVSFMGKLTGLGGTGDGSLFITNAAPGQGWLSPDTSLSWKVDNFTTPGMWHYEYTISVPTSTDLWAHVQCIIVETSNGTNGPIFTTGDLYSPASTPEEWLQQVNVGLHSPADNANLPRNLYGIKFCTADIDPTYLTIAFDSTRAPVWGDFYARSFVIDGQFNAFYNWGLLGMPETDPLDPPSNGSILSHVLVPDSISVVQVIPAPTAMLLSVMGLPLAGWLRRNRSL